MTASGFLNLLRGKNVVFITVKDKDYIRTTQIKRLLEKEASSWRVYSSEKGNPITRALDLRRRIKKLDLLEADVVILGFLPQLIIDAVKKRIAEANKSSSKIVEFAAGKRAETSPILVSEMFLSMYDTVISDRHIFRDGGWISDWMKRLDKRAIEAADFVVTDTKANADYLSGLYGADRSKFETLYLEADKDIYGGIAGGSENDKLMDSADSDSNAIYKVLYFGTGLPLQGTDIVIEAFNQVAGKKQIQCTYVGSTRKIPNSVLNEAGSNPDIRIAKWLSQEELAREISEATLCIAGHFNPNIGKADRTIPGKAYIYEAMGKPMILGDTRANREIFTEDSNHIFVERGNSRALADAITTAISIKGKRVLIG
jgi:glycosyltransferase involved in cell wall biosynthesis